MQRLPLYGLTLALLLAPLSACSQDKHVFRSTTFTPTTAAIRELINDEILWSRDVPVGYKLVMNLDSGMEIEGFTYNAEPADRFSWKIANLRTNEVVEKGKQRLPGIPIMIERTLRPAPEAPANYIPPDSAEVPPPPPVETPEHPSPAEQAPAEVEPAAPTDAAEDEAAGDNDKATLESALE